MPDNVNENTKNYFNESYKSIKNRNQRCREYFQSLNISIIVEWECAFLAKNGKLKESEKEPLDSLIPRDGLRGGKTESYCEYTLK